VVLKGDPNNTDTGEVRERRLGHRIAQDCTGFQLQVGVCRLCDGQLCFMNVPGLPVRSL